MREPVRRQRGRVEGAQTGKAGTQHSLCSAVSEQPLPTPWPLQAVGPPVSVLEGVSLPCLQCCKSGLSMHSSHYT